MRRVLLTGMSAVGKSTIAERLSELGYKVVDTDYGGYSVADEDGAQRWDVDRMRRLLATEDADVLLVVGADDAQVLFYPDFDHIISAERAARRHGRAARGPDQQPVGKSSDELARFLADLETHEPMIRRAATHEIDHEQAARQCDR